MTKVLNIAKECCGDDTLEFTTVENQNDYTFNGTSNAYNPLSKDLVGVKISNLFTDGIRRTEATNYTFNKDTGTISLIGTVSADVAVAINFTR